MLRRGNNSELRDRYEAKEGELARNGGGKQKERERWVKPSNMVSSNISARNGSEMGIVPATLYSVVVVPAADVVIGRRVETQTKLLHLFWRSV